MVTKIKYVNVPQNIKKDVEDKILAKAKEMPVQRYKSFLELNDKKVKLENIISYYMLLNVLKNEKIVTKNLKFTYKENGKPYFENSNIKFNISHSENIIVVAVSDDEIGIDVEKIKELKTNLIDWVYSANEKKEYQTKLSNKDFFYKTWTIKESFIKYDGAGLNIDLDTLSFNLESNLNIINNLFIDTYKINDFYLSICSNSKEHKIEELKFEQLFS